MNKNLFFKSKASNKTLQNLTLYTVSSCCISVIFTTFDKMKFPEIGSD